ncbi:MAG TPA: electron transport complex subunit RsxE [Spirochaetia bacterium]|nr:electron transport complex subunit RsxE [Spirochaetia bacterium]
MTNTSTPAEDFSKGILRQNPIFVTMLGLCPALAVTNLVVNAVAMGIAVAVVLLATSFTVSLLREFVPDKIRIPTYTVIIAIFVTIVDLMMQAYLPGMSRNLGIFVPLIVVNCIILSRADSFARENTAGRALLDALGMGTGFTLGLTLIAAVRETLGSGTITLFPIAGFSGVITVPVLSHFPVRVLGLGTGAFLVVGYMKAFFNWRSARLDRDGRRGGRPNATNQVV